MRLFLVILILATLLSSVACATPVTGTATLRCGGATFTVVTVHDADMPPDDAFGYLSQTISFRSSSNSRKKILAPETSAKTRLPGGQMALSVIVQSWACLRADNGRHYVLLDLSCQRADQAGACGGQAEWFRILSPSGNRLDAGFTPQDQRYTALYARLGIQVNGVAMQDATGP